MKSKRSFAGLLCFALTVFSVALLPGCGSDDRMPTDTVNNDGGGDDGTPSDGEGPKLSFKKDGTLVDFADANDAAYHKHQFGIWTLVVSVNAPAKGQSFTLTISTLEDEEVRPGTYDCSVAKDESAKVKAKMAYRQGEEWKPELGAPCWITVTELGGVGERVKGTFAGTLVSEKADGAELVLTDGTFDVELGAF